MTRRAPMVVRIAAGAVVLVLACSSTPVQALTLRAPQVVFQSATLQGLMDQWDGHINVLTDQLSGQGLSVVPNNCLFRLYLVLRVAGGASIGVYNTQSVAGPPALCEVFPSEARPYWSVSFDFLTDGEARTTLWDESFQFVRTVTYSGLDPRHIGFYVSTPNGVGYIEDSRNANQPRALLFSGTQAEQNFGSFFLCFENADYDPNASTFAREVVEFDLSSECVTPAHTPTWGSLKAAYR